MTLAYVVSKRPFTGSWEYLLDIADSHRPHRELERRGAGGSDLKLLGVGSLIVREATSDEGGLLATCSCRSMR